MICTKSVLPASSVLSFCTAASGRVTCVSVPGRTIDQTVTSPNSVGRTMLTLYRSGIALPGSTAQEMVPLKPVTPVGAVRVGMGSMGPTVTPVPVVEMSPGCRR